MLEKLFVTRCPSGVSATMRTTNATRDNNCRKRAQSSPHRQAHRDVQDADRQAEEHATIQREDHRHD